MLAHLLSLSILFAPPAGESPAAGDPTRASESETGSETQPDFGEIEADPESSDDSPQGSGSGSYDGAASGSYGGALAPQPNYGEYSDIEQVGELEQAPEPKPKKARKQEFGFEEPEDFGPFFEPEPVSEVKFPGDGYRPDRKHPFASVGGGTFCFVEDSMCAASLLIDADVGVGLNVISSDRGFNVPYTQFRVRGGVTVRPVKLVKKRWHPWGIGLVGSWSLGSGSITATNRDASDAATDVIETDPIRSWRVAMINQIWLAQKRNALHLDFTLGGVNSSVLDAQGRYWGTHVELAVGLGGWGGIYFAGDFLDADTRVFMGMRGHGIATGPLIALIVLGLVAGGVAL